MPAIEPMVAPERMLSEGIASPREVFRMPLEFSLPQLEWVPASSGSGSVAPTRFLVWSTRLLFGGVFAALLLGWGQDISKVAAIRAEPGPTRVIVITKEEAWLRTHPRPRPQPKRSTVTRQPSTEAE